MPKRNLLARQRRRGSATLWLIIWLPCLLALFVTLVGVANLWLARVELENAVEAAALAAVKQWGDAGGGDTLIPRQVGVEYADANIIRGNPLTIGLNYDPATGGPNQNDECNPTAATVSPPNGNLVFGAIDDTTNLDNVVFNAGIRPSCFPGTVLFDVSAQRDLGADNAWGISFQCSPDVPANLRIRRIVIDLQANGGAGLFDLGGSGPSGGGPDISDNSPEGIFSVTCNQTTYTQPDNVGFTDLNEGDANNDGQYDGQIRFTPTGGFSPTLTIDFFPDTNPIGGTDDGFAPGDRFRFGADTDGVSSQNGQDNGDGIGRDAVQVTVIFELGGIELPAITGVYFDNDTEGRNDCICPPQTSPCDNSLIVHPALIPNLPCPPSSANGNNGQSYVLLSGSGNGKFGVRAQAMVPITPLGGVPFVGVLAPQCVWAKATAIYDCATRRPRLIRIDTFICPGP